ncbi:3-methyl-2-oxobutanoate dehydrogenase (Ferredoxin), alpha subunit [Candidatus Vecturithrix granuli]|uniref:3-methyl-2-oxobutanoate dehydrogenase (Ferredoxin), alpha subunit n=1 Tax=Vecturithrix granuli TaxID=1499967 RepID=A0A081C5T5_VECG1|nr:3-methyl-2-oxobutanoate dehydrogenase (Ferredoxin), alpha subunit [Candidatus Vecturithrix granuli]
MAKVLMKGNEAIGAAAINAGCRFFFGYPITPQNELPEYMSRELPKVGGTYLQAESEVAAINMVYGAAGAGARVMTSSSSPGISLKQEGISYIAGAELPCVIINVVRGGPGLGGIQPAQSDYFQATKGGGHGDYHLLVLAPSSLQETVELVEEAFDLADKYRNPVMILADGMIGQIMEPVEIKPYTPYQNLPPKDWASTGTIDSGGRRRIINSLFLDPTELEQHVLKIYRKYAEMEKQEVRYELYNCENADIIMVAYGTTARIVRTAIEQCERIGIHAGLIRPISLYPFPYHVFDEVVDRAKAFLSVEMSMGQMVDDVKIAAAGRKPVYFYGRTGGMIPMPEEIVKKIQAILQEG